MFAAMASLQGFLILVSIFAVAALGSLALGKNDKLANLVGNIGAALGGLFGLVFAASALINEKQIDFELTFSTFNFFALSLHIDKLAAFFILIISLISLFCSFYATAYVREYYKRYNLGILGFVYNLFILGMILVVTASNGLWFLLAWELMSLASYFMVVYDRANAQNVKAGYVYLVMTHVGAACILLAFSIIFACVGSFDFDVISACITTIPVPVMAVVFGLFMVGLGTKSGVIPLHIWLPSAHPAAPSHVSALMSGVMIKTGIYMMIRLFMDVLQPIPEWWGFVVLGLGIVSALMGVLYALTAHDIKKLLAYHSIENIGIILLGLGGAMIFSANQMPVLGSLALCAALFHTLNHATFKSLLFLSAGSVIQATHTKNIEKYGGLLKYMPLTGLVFLVGAMAISALPPFNGFFSEWLTYQSLLGGMSAMGNSKWLFLLAGVALAITGGLALACFVKVFGTTFLARPRSRSVGSAKESSLIMLIGMGFLAAVCLFIGVFSSWVVSKIQVVASQLTGMSDSIVAAEFKIDVSAFGQSSSVSGIVIAAVIFVSIVATWLVIKKLVNRNQKVRIAPTWDCGTPLNGRMEITAGSFARSILQIFSPLTRPKLQCSTEYGPVNKYAIKMRVAVMSSCDVFQSYLFKPAYSGMLFLSKNVKKIQNGNLNVYVLYVLGALLLALFIGVF